MIDPIIEALRSIEGNGDDDQYVRITFHAFMLFEALYHNGFLGRDELKALAQCVLPVLPSDSTACLHPEQMARLGICRAMANWYLPQVEIDVQ